VTPEALGRRIHEALDRAGIPHMLTGSFAAAYHGVPRATQDIDLVIAPDPGQLRSFVHLLPPTEFYVDEDAALEALRTEGQFNAIEVATGWKIDLICRKHRSFSRTEFDRREIADLWGVPMAVATLEDLIIAKLEWARTGGSERQVEDVAALLQLRLGDLDREYLDHWIAEIALTDAWKRALVRAGLGG
jgi:hypothetical protein